jgi:hypothetical protein
MKIIHRLVIIILFSCSCTNNENGGITLKLEKKVNSYNDSTFISTGYIFPGFNNGYVISDLSNGFLGLIEENFSNLQTIGFKGKGGGINEFLFLPVKIHCNNNSIRTFEKTPGKLIKMRSFDIESHNWSYKILNGPQDKIISGDFCITKDETIIFKSIPTDSSLFVSYNLKTGKTSYIMKNQSPIVSQNKIPSFTIVNDSLLAVLYDNNPRLEIYSIKTGLYKTSFEVPLNNKIKEILNKFPEAPIFQGGVFSFNNRIFISYNGVGMIDGKISNNGRNINWTFLNFPETEDDFLAMNNFIVTNSHIIIFTQGEFKVFENPYF